VCPQLITMVSKCKGGNFLLCRLNIDVCMRKYVWSWLLLYPYRCSKHFPFSIFSFILMIWQHKHKKKNEGCKSWTKNDNSNSCHNLMMDIFSNLLSNYVHQLVMHLALIPLENFLHTIYPIQWHLYMQLCTMRNNIRNVISA